MCIGRIMEWLKETFGISEGDIEPYLPIDSEEKLRQFMKNELCITCEGIFTATIPYDTVPDQYGYIGNRVTTLIGSEKRIIGYISLVECKAVDEYDDKGNPVSGHILFNLEFDPNNGWIRKFYHSPEILADKPVIYRRPMSENPDYGKYVALGP